MSDSETESPINPVTLRRWFGIVAVAEAISWGGLLIAMVFKWIIQDDPNTGIEGGVPIMGPIHGTVFIGFVIVSVLAWRTYGWTARTLLTSLASAIPPFATIWFERKAVREGLLEVPASA